MAHVPFLPLGTLTLAIATLAACGTPTSGSTPTATSPVTVTASPSAPPAAASPTLRPDGFGALTLGMTKAQAAATGLFDVDVKSTTCEGTDPLRPKAPYASSFDVVLDQTGHVIALGGSAANLVTSTGIHAGSTLAQVRAAYPQASAPTDLGGDAAAYHQSGVFIRDRQDYLGLLFDATAAKVKATDTVKFMEIRHGGRPGLFRDGC